MPQENKPTHSALFDDEAKRILKPTQVRGYRSGLYADIEHDHHGLVVQFQLEDGALTPTYQIKEDKVLSFVAMLLEKTAILNDPVKMKRYIETADHGKGES